MSENMRHKASYQQVKPQHSTCAQPHRGITTVEGHHPLYPFSITTPPTMTHHQGDPVPWAQVLYSVAHLYETQLGDLNSPYAILQVFMLLSLCRHTLRII